MSEWKMRWVTGKNVHYERKKDVMRNVVNEKIEDRKWKGMTIDSDKRKIIRK